MSATQPIEDLVIRFIRDQLHPGSKIEVDPEENLFTSGLVDSIGAMRLVNHVETELNTRIPPPDLIPANFRTIRVMATYLCGLKPS
jgi:acyl carrier protein